MKAITQKPAIVVMGQVSRPSQARAIVAELRKAGHSERHVAMIPYPGLVPAPQHGTCMMEAAATGGVAGGVLGLLLGTSETVVIPALEPLTAQGPLVAALGGVAGGGALGVIVGAVVGLMVSFVDAKFFQGSAPANIRLAVQVAAYEWRNQAKWILERGGAVDIVTVRARPLGNHAWR